MDDEKPTAYMWQGQIARDPLSKEPKLVFLGTFPGGRTFPPGTGAPASELPTEWKLAKDDENG